MKNTLMNARLIQASLGMGIALFFVVVLIAFIRGGAHPAEPTLGTMRLLRAMTIVNTLLLPVAWTLGRFLQGQIMKQSAYELAPGTLSPEDAQAARWLIGRILVLATREGSAFFGLIVCQMGVRTGVIYAYPLFWLNALSAVLLILYVMVSFPDERDMYGA
jgi:hypothetical protein